MVAKALAYLGGVFAVLSGLISALTQKPTIYYITGAEPLAGSILIVTGIIAIIGGLLVFYGASRNSYPQVILGGVLGLIAPCILSVLAIIGGFLMARQPKSIKQ